MTPFITGPYWWKRRTTITSRAGAQCQSSDGGQNATMTTTSSTNESAQFGPTNIPFGVISTNDNPKPRIATRLFDQVFSLADLISRGYLDKLDDQTKSSLTQVQQFSTLVRHTTDIISKHLMTSLALVERSIGRLENCYRRFWSLLHPGTTMRLHLAP